MQDPHKAQIVRSHLAVPWPLVNGSSKGVAVRIYKRLQSVNQSAHVMDVGEDCWCLGRWADDGRNDGG